MSASGGNGGHVHRLVLKDLFHRTGGTDWTNNIHWNLKQNHSLWHGVRTDDVGHVVRLELHSNNLRGEIPQSFGYMIHLQALDLSSNFLGGELECEVISLISQLRERYSSIYLYDNEPGFTLPRQFTPTSFLQELTTLDLSNSSLIGTIPESISALVNMTSIDLSDNKLEGHIPESVTMLTNLAFLRLGNNLLSGMII
jgi:Leucine-rich repeat (LRR) protein